MPSTNTLSLHSIHCGARPRSGCLVRTRALGSFGTPKLQCAYRFLAFRSATCNAASQICQRLRNMPDGSRRGQTEELVDASAGVLLTLAPAAPIRGCGLFHPTDCAGTRHPPEGYGTLPRAATEPGNGISRRFCLKSQVDRGSFKGTRHVL